LEQYIKDGLNLGAGYTILCLPLMTRNPYISNHFIGGINMSYDFKDWLKFTAKTGLDYANEKATTYFPAKYSR